MFLLTKEKVFCIGTGKIKVKGAHFVSATSYNTIHSKKVSKEDPS